MYSSERIVLTLLFGLRIAVNWILLADMLPASLLSSLLASMASWSMFVVMVVLLLLIPLK